MRSHQLTTLTPRLRFHHPEHSYVAMHFLGPLLYHWLLTAGSHNRMSANYGDRGEEHAELAKPCAATASVCGGSQANVPRCWPREPQLGYQRRLQMTDDGRYHDDISGYRNQEYRNVRSHFLNSHGVLNVTVYFMPETPPGLTSFTFFIKTFLNDKK